MTKSKHYQHYPNARKLANYLFPHVCLECRKSFKKPASPTARICPECGGALVQLSRKFKPPKKRDLEQWAKVRFLVEHGFSFYSVYQRHGTGDRRVAYPKNLVEAREFVKGKKREATLHSRLPPELTYGLRDLPLVTRTPMKKRG